MKCDRPIPRRFTLAIFAVAFTALVQGCVGPRGTAPAVDPSQLSDETFQAYLADAGLVTVDEAYRAMLILADGEDSSQSFEDRRAKLESRGIARPAWRLEPQNVIDAGSVAFMVCRLCEIRGGVNASLFGRMGLGDRRYALRELLYREMIDETVDYQYMTGPALVAVMAKADELMEERGLYETETVDLTDEADREESGDLIVPPPDTERGS
ncbi:MAG: hypothetical protein JXQ75_03365 [Phycisphaerae bacterium]|nr:hypothetical protein [Phycisphaerae bacterium]